MTFKTKYAEYPDCEFVPARYCNGNLALQVISETEGPITTCTVNPGFTIEDNAIAIKNYSENDGMVDTLKGMGIIGKELYRVRSGFVEIPIYELTEKGLEIFKGK